MKRTRGKSLVALTAALALGLAACGGDTEGDDTPDAGNGGGDTTSDGGDDDGDSTDGDSTGGTGEITVGVAYETTNYHPSNTSSALAMGTNWHVVEGLYEFHMHDYSVYAALAADEDPVQVSDTEYEVTLRDGAKFSDGTDITSEDVVTSFERSMAEGNIYVTMLDFIESVEAKDDTTVTINLHEPFSLVKERLAVVKIVPASASDEELTSKPIGSGPWKYDSISDTEVVAVPNEHYNGSYPAGAETMRWNVLKDDTARTTAAQDGTIQVMENVPAENVSILEGAGLTVEKKPGFNLPFLLFNTSKAPLDDPLVRQAFFYAIDTEKLVSNAMSGEATAATSFLPESHPNYNEAEVQFDYDPEKARELLAEAGAEDLSITLLTTDHPWIEGLSPQIRTDLEAVGITVSVQAEASASLYSNNLDVDNPTFDVALAPCDPSVFGQDPALLMNWWYGDNIWTQKRSFWQESDAEAFGELQSLISEAVGLDGDDQQEKWDEAQDLLSREVPIYPLFHRTMITAYNADELADVKPIATTGISLVGVSTK